MFDVDEFVAACSAAMAETQPRLAVKEVVERAVSRPSEMDAVLGGPAKVGLHALFVSPEFTVLHVVWPPSVSLYPHDHRMWAANGIYGGREDNVFYRRTDAGIVSSGGRELQAAEVALLGDEAIHSVTNPSRGYTVAVHVYGGGYFGGTPSEWGP